MRNDFVEISKQPNLGFLKRDKLSTNQLSKNNINVSDALRCLRHTIFFGEWVTRNEARRSILDT